MGVIMNPPLTSGGCRTSSLRLDPPRVKGIGGGRAVMCGHRATMTA